MMVDPVLAGFAATLCMTMLAEMHYGYGGIWTHRISALIVGLLVYGALAV